MDLSLETAAVPGRSNAEGSGVWFRRLRLPVPFLAAALFYLLVTSAVLAAAWLRAEHHFIYPLDDVYINMAVAKNFALHGVWGVSPFEFASCTSSPLYVLLLSGVYRVFGPDLYAPLLLSWLFGLIALYVAAGILKKTISAGWQTAALIAFILLIPLFGIGTIGMEHTLHLMAVLLFLSSFQDETKPLWLIAVLTSLMGGARYEGLLMAACATVALALQRRWLRAAVIAVSAWIPAGIYAAFSLSHGGYWLPNSIALKGVKLEGGVLQRLLNVVQTVVSNTTRAPYLLLLAVAVLLMAYALRRTQGVQATMLAVLGGTALLHVMTADVAWVYRYDAYLIGASIVAVASAWPHFAGARPVLLRTAQVFLSLAALLLIVRCERAATKLPKFSRAVYLQQWQTARFLHEDYEGQAVAANDIGAINYFADLHSLDLVGLASTPILNARRAGHYNTAFLAETTAADHIQIAVVYDAWFSDHHPGNRYGGPPLPASWIRVRRWTVPEQQQLGGVTVSFYATNPAQAALLRARLNAFEPTLPKDVSVDSK